jgi:hypothetical protein
MRMPSSGGLRRVPCADTRAASFQGSMMRSEPSRDGCSLVITSEEEILP